jgi:hypothetical protein
MSVFLVDVLSVIRLKREQVLTLRKFLVRTEEFVDEHDFPADYVERHIAVPLEDLRDYWDEVDSHLAKVSAFLDDAEKVEDKLEAAFRELVIVEQMLVDLFEREAHQLMVQAVEIQSTYLKTQSLRPFKNSNPASVALASLRDQVEAGEVLPEEAIGNVASADGIDRLFSHVEAIVRDIERLKYRVVPASGTRRALIILGAIGGAAAIGRIILAL